MKPIGTQLKLNFQKVDPSSLPDIENLLGTGETNRPTVPRVTKKRRRRSPSPDSHTETIPLHIREECPDQAKDFDGFRITYKGSRDFIPGVHDWESESTAWFNMSKLKFLGTTKV